jgi:hypothetical protein
VQDLARLLRGEQLARLGGRHRGVCGTGLGSEGNGALRRHSRKVAGRPESPGSARPTHPATRAGTSTSLEFSRSRSRRRVHPHRATGCRRPVLRWMR